MSPADVDAEDKEWENTFNKANGNELGYVRHNGHAAVKMSLAVARTPTSTSRSGSPSTLSTSSYAFAGDNSPNKHLHSYSNNLHQHHRRRSSSSYIHSHSVGSYASPTDSVNSGSLVQQGGFEGRGTGSQTVSNPTGTQSLLITPVSQSILATTNTTALTRPNVDSTAIEPTNYQDLNDLEIENTSSPTSLQHRRRQTLDTQYANSIGSGLAADWSWESSGSERRNATTITTSATPNHEPLSHLCIPRITI